MRYVIDIDGTICSPITGRDYTKAEPWQGRIDKVNKLYDEGHEIVYFTARGMGNCGGNASCAYGKWYTFTHKQLTEWGCKFNELILGKPHAEYYIDDKGWSDKVFFNNNR